MQLRRIPLKLSSLCSSKNRARYRNLLIFLAPVLIFFVALVIYPLCRGIYISFFRTNLLNRWDFIGLRNYLNALSGTRVLESLAITFIFTAVVVIGHFLMGITLAITLNKPFFGQRFFRVLLILPWLFPEVVVALNFRWFFNSMYGPVSYMLERLGFSGLEWLGNPTLALITVILACIWKGYPLVMTMMLAGLQTIPEEQYEAARVDGATFWGELRYITLPGLMNVSLVVLILDTVWWFKHFTIIWNMTQGGPASATNVISIDIYRTAFMRFNFGQAAALSVVVLIICGVASVIYRRLLEYED